MNRKTITAGEFLSVFFLCMLSPFFFYESVEQVSFPYSFLQVLLFSSAFLILLISAIFLKKKDTLTFLAMANLPNKWIKDLVYALLFLSLIWISSIHGAKILRFSVREFYKLQDYMPLLLLFTLFLAYSLFVGFSPLAKTSMVINAFVVLFLLFLVVLCVKNIFFLKKITPLFFVSKPFQETGKIFSLFSFFELFLLLLFLRETADEKKVLLGWSFLSFVGSLFCFFLLFITAQLTYFAQGNPIYNFVSRSVGLPIFRKLDIFFFLLWIFIGFVKTSLLLNGAKEVLKEMFAKEKIEKERHVLSAFTALAFFAFSALFYWNDALCDVCFDLLPIFFICLLSVGLIAYLLQRKRRKNENCA